jgi:hypothetical protein
VLPAAAVCAREGDSQFSAISLFLSLSRALASYLPVERERVKVEFDNNTNIIFSSVLHSKKDFSN